jgi:prepilin-type N-terminal cleavage/methylation domain-containing protein
MKTTGSHTRVRVGFTLIELLVVVAIIAILVGLSAAAVIRFIPSQQVSNTRNTITKLQTLLNKAVVDVVEEAKNEAIPDTYKDTYNTYTIRPNVLALAGGDARRARVIWIKLRLRQEFPMSYAEATNPVKDMSGNVYIWPKSNYVRKIGNLPPAAGETGACLFLALTQSRRGKQVLGENELSSNELRDTDFDGLPELIDDWGNPLALYRWPIGNPEIVPTTNTLNKDPQDPEGLLLSSSWNSTLFEQLCHSLTDPVTLQRSARNYTNPVIASSGPNGQFGLDPWMATTNAQYASDNIYSYRLKVQGARGD